MKKVRIGEKLIKTYHRNGKRYQVLCNGIDHWCLQRDENDLLVNEQKLVGSCDCVER